MSRYGSILTYLCGRRNIYDLIILSLRCDGRLDVGVNSEEHNHRLDGKIRNSKVKDDFRVFAINVSRGQDQRKHHEHFIKLNHDEGLRAARTLLKSILVGCLLFPLDDCCVCCAEEA